MSQRRQYPHNGQPRIRWAIEVVAVCVAVIAVAFAAFVVLSLLLWLL